MTNYDTSNPVLLCRVASRPRAFTLIELMVSIALVLILVLGINTVFRIASTSIGAGNALSDVTRDNRAIQATINNDFQNALIRSGDMPAFVIRSTRRSAFRDEAEALGDRDFQALGGTGTRDQVDAAIRTRDLDDNNTEGEATVPGENLTGYDLSDRNHRLDVMCFFARYRYPRQTGNDGTYVANMGSNEAFISYGHLMQPKVVGATTVLLPTNNMPPGWDSGGTPLTASDNPNNLYSRQWGFGRSVILMKDPDATTSEIGDRAGVSQYYIARLLAAGAPPNDNTAPISPTAIARIGTTPEPDSAMAESRYDLAGMSISTYTNTLRRVVRPVALNPPVNGGSLTWWNQAGLTMRFVGFPSPTKPLTSYGAARTVPWLVSGCTNFIVEYAGDFLTQELDPTVATYGAVTGDYSAGTTDNTIDFVINANGERRIRWYGFPRDVAGITAPTANGPDGLVTAQGSAGLPPSGSPDVLPLRDSLPSASAALVQMNPGAPKGAAFERFAVGQFDPSNYNAPGGTEQGVDYAAAWLPAGEYYDATGTQVADPPKPLMIRITMTIDDPNGRLPAGQTYEYVINLP